MSDGFDALQQKLTALKGDALAKAERKALKAVGNLVKDKMVALAPEQTTDTPGGDLAPGELKASISARVHVASDARAATDVSRVTIGPGKATAYVARFVENGHEARRSSTKEGPPNFVPAHPFVRPAADATQQAAIDLYAETMREEVQRVMNS